ncbi:MAG TPA: hypothetical protein VEZ14_14975 [Dehalococcoidia bacterium]|nr:hypothetical protein [Dehalococcoidia bacterium]
MTRRPALLAVACLVLPAFALLACRSSSSANKTPTAAAATASVTAAPAPTGSPLPRDAIRGIDVAAVADVKQLVASTSAHLDPARVIYADLTGAGQEDAIIPLASGGTLGDVAFVVLAPAPGGGTTTLLKLAPRDTRGLAVAVEGGKLVMTEPVPGPDDPLCCPSMLKKTTYAWDGTTLAVASAVNVRNPSGGAKGTPSIAPATP